MPSRSSSSAIAVLSTTPKSTPWVWLPSRRVVSKSQIRSLMRPLPSVPHDRPDRLAFVHQVEAFVDAVQRQGVRNQRVDVDLAVHVPDRKSTRLNSSH